MTARSQSRTHTSIQLSARHAASLLLAHSGAELAEMKFVLDHSQIAHTVDLYRPPGPGRLEGLRPMFDAAFSAAASGPAQAALVT